MYSGGRYAGGAHADGVPGATTYALSLLLPNGVDRWVGLFSSAPRPDGGGTEVTAAGYVRVAVDSWVEISEGVDLGRANAAAIEFAGFAFPDSLSIEAAGIFDASVAGNLIAWLPITPIEGGLTATDQVRFVTERLAFFARA